MLENQKINYKVYYKTEENNKFILNLAKENPSYTKLYLNETTIKEFKVNNFLIKETRVSISKNKKYNKSLNNNLEEDKPLNNKSLNNNLEEDIYIISEKDFDNKKDFFNSNNLFNEFTKTPVKNYSKDKVDIKKLKQTNLLSFFKKK